MLGSQAEADRRSVEQDGPPNRPQARSGPGVDHTHAYVLVFPVQRHGDLQPPEPCVAIPVDKGIARPRTRRACGSGGPIRRGAASSPRSAERAVLTHLLTTALDQPG